MTPLAARLRAEIRKGGPIPIARFMERALADPEHGYYRTRDPLGAAGDFVTAPEVSQMFGELLGLWAAVVWQAMGAPGRVLVVELGPGRGTLASDALRAVRRTMPAFADAAELHLVETSPVLRAAQARTLGDRTATWHDALDTVPAGPAILIANEFLDALPVHQLQFADGAWRERLVDVASHRADERAGEPANERFRIVLDRTPSPLAAAIPVAAGPPAEGAVFELSPAALEIGGRIAARAVDGPGAALIVDYGHAAPGFGDTLQAVRAHRMVDPFASPGEADLTAHVDFAAVAAAARAARAATWGPVAQGDFLRALGIEARRDMLLRTATPEQRRDIETGFRRLVDPQGMGTLFKVLCIAAPTLDTPPGFAA